MNYYNLNNRGITLIEIILSIAILSVLLSGIFIWFLGYHRKAELDSNSKIIISVLRQAQSNSKSGKDSKEWGVRFDSSNNRFIFFRDEGSGYGNGSGIIVKEESYLSSFVKISDISLNGGGDEIIFNKPKGETVQYGTIRIEDTNTSGNYLDIIVSSVGLISSQ